MFSVLVPALNPLTLNSFSIHIARGSCRQPAGPRALPEMTIWGDALDSVLPFTASEKEFLDRLLDCGEIKSALLIENEGLTARTRFPPYTALKRTWIPISESP